MAIKIEVAGLRSAKQPKGGNPAAAETFQKAALDLFSSRNYSAVTIKDIAIATGVTPSLLYYYFENKDRLFLSVLDVTIAEVFGLSEGVFKSDMEPASVISLWLQNHIDNYELFQKLIKIMMDYSGTHSRSPEVNNAIDRFYDTEAKVLQGAIRRGMKSGTFRKVSPVEVTDLIATFLDGVLVRPLIRSGFQPKQAIVEFQTFLMEYLSRDRVRIKKLTLKGSSRRTKTD